MNKIHIIIFFIISISLILYFVSQITTKQIEQPPIKVKESPQIKQPPVVQVEQPQVEQPQVEQPQVVQVEQPQVEQPQVEQPPIKVKEPPVVICPENNNDNYTFSTEAKLGKDIIKSISQFIKMFITPIREMFVPLVGFITDTRTISSDKSYIVGNINSTGTNAITNANLQVKNGGTTCTDSFPNKIYIELKVPTQSVIDFCNTNLNTYYPLTKNVSINIGDATNQNLINITPNTLDSCVYDIAYNFNNLVPYGKTGRYIVIYYAGSVNQSFLNLAELSALDFSNKNVALNKPVTMSSTLSGYPGRNLVDGNINTFCHTNNVCPWLYVDLGADIPLKQITVTNRLDCCQTRLTGFRMGLVTSNNFNSMLTALRSPVTVLYPDTTGVSNSISVLNIRMSINILSFNRALFGSTTPIVTNL